MKTCYFYFGILFFLSNIIHIHTQCTGVQNEVKVVHLKQILPYDIIEQYAYDLEYEIVKKLTDTIYIFRDISCNTFSKAINNNNNVLRSINELSEFTIDKTKNTQDHVLQVETQQKIIHYTRDSPDTIDFSNIDITDPLYNRQWHLDNTESMSNPRMDIKNVWKMGIFGDGITVVINDDGLLSTHPDIKPNFSPDASHNYNTPSNSLPTPTSGQHHGTNCGGIPSASFDGGACGAGIAPNSTVGGVKTLGGSLYPWELAEALTYGNPSGVSCSWGPADTGTIISFLDVYTRQAMKEQVKRGTTYIHAAGNGNDNAVLPGYSIGDQCSKDGWINNAPLVIPVSAVTHKGVRAWYSEQCEAVFVSGSSCGDGKWIVTTDIGHQTSNNYHSTGNCRIDFGGTSAAAPGILGVIALIHCAANDAARQRGVYTQSKRADIPLEPYETYEYRKMLDTVEIVLDTNNYLSQKDIQFILQQTSIIVDKDSDSWITNGAGILHSKAYGFGLANATAAVILAKNWTSIGNIWNEYTVPFSHLDATTGLSIPDASSGNRVTNPLTVMQIVSNINEPVRWVSVVLNILHTARGDLRIELISPSMTVATLVSPHNDKNNDYVFSVASVKTWGEDANGTWQIKIIDEIYGNHGSLYAVSLTFYT